MGLLFLFAVAVQYNDPDPLRWMALYGAAAAASLLVAWRGQAPIGLPAATCLLALVWAAWIGPPVLGRVSSGELFAEFEMASPVIEEAREAVGLLIVAGWMAVVLLASGLRPREPVRA